MISFNSNNSSSLSRKTHGGGNFSLRPRQRLQGQNKSVGIGLIELTEPSDTWNYEPFFKYCIFQTILHVILLFIFVWTKYFVPKTKPCYIYIYIYIYIFWFGVTFGGTVLKLLCF